MLWQYDPVEHQSRAKTDRMAEIVSGASRLFHARGYSNTSINDLAESLGMSVGGLYRYIDTKSDLLVKVCDDIYGTLPAELAELVRTNNEPVTRLTAVVERFLRSCLDHAPLILLMYREYRHLPTESRREFQAREESIASMIQAELDSVAALRNSGDMVDTWCLAHDIIAMGHLPALKSWAVRTRRSAERDLVADQISIVLAAVSGSDPRDRSDS